MKQVIDGKRYDTETAERVAYDDNSLPVNDFNNWDETLYRTKNGRWFVHGRGGPLTRYAEPVGNGWTGGQEIRPLTETQARTWCEHHQSKAELIARSLTTKEA